MIYLKDKIIKLDSKDDIKNFEKDLWLYRSFLHKKTNFILESSLADETYTNIINALNIKNKLKRITFVYDSACKQIDDYNIKNHISCDFKDGKCGAHQNTKHYNGCCRVCRYQSPTGCKTKNLSCKLFFCGYVCSKSKPLTFNDLKILKCLSVKRRMITDMTLFLSRKKVIIALYLDSFIILSIFHTISILFMPSTFLKNRRLAIEKYKTRGES